MEWNYPYKLVDGHVIVTADERLLLIDTGAPLSVADTSPLAFGGREWEVVPNYMGVTMGWLSERIGAPTDALVGMDILQHYDIFVDAKQQVVSVSNEELPTPAKAECMPLTFCMGIPILPAMASKVEIQAIFDTGAKLSYVNSELCEGLAPQGEVEDFYPGFGNFTTQTYLMPLTIGSQPLTLRVGTLPDLLQSMLDAIGASGIIGSAVLDTHHIFLSPRRATLSLQPKLLH